MSYRLLLLGTDANGRARLHQFLAEKVSVKATEDAVEGISLACKGVYDLVVLDATLQSFDGFDVLRLIRARCDVPVVMLMESGPSDRIMALKLGADDCVSPNCNLQELAARVEAILRRYSPATSSGRPIEIGTLRIDPGSRSAWARGALVSLTSAEYIILEALMRAAGRVVTRERLSWTLRQRESSGLDRSLDVHMARLRSKLGRPSPIRTVRGEGYFFCNEPLGQRDEV